MSQRTSPPPEESVGLPAKGLRFGRRAVDAAADAAADGEHHAALAVVGALGAVLGDAAAELGELQQRRLVEQPLVLHVGVERRDRAVDRRHQALVGAGGRRAGALLGMRVVAAGLHPEHLGADAADDRPGDRAQRVAEAGVRIGRGRRVLRHLGDAVHGRERALRRGVDERQVRAVDRHVRRDARRRGARVALIRRAAVRARERVLRRARNRRHRDGARDHRPRQLAVGVPADQRIDRQRQRVEVAPEPARALRRGHARRRPDVGAEEVRAAQVRIAGALDHGHAALVEDVAQADQVRVQAERVAGAVAADLQHRSRRDGDRRPARVVEGVAVGHDGVQRVVAAAEVEHHQVARGGTLGVGDVGQERRRGEAPGERGDAALDEVTSCECHNASKPAGSTTSPAPGA